MNELPANAVTVGRINTVIATSVATDLFGGPIKYHGTGGPSHTDQVVERVRNIRFGWLSAQRLLDVADTLDAIAAAIPRDAGDPRCAGHNRDQKALAAVAAKLRGQHAYRLYRESDEGRRVNMAKTHALMASSDEALDEIRSEYGITPEVAARHEEMCRLDQVSSL